MEAPILLRDRGGPANPVQTPKSKPDDGVRRDEDHRILCASCRAPLTDEECRVDRAGAHRHCFVNPHGFVFEIGCFVAALGCSVFGVATTEHSWFTGYAWRYAHCGSCAAHVGWFFEDGKSDTFFGLILDRLMDSDA